MIETIYQDVVAHPPASRYTLLIEQLERAESAKKIHEGMAARVLLRHQQRIDTLRAALEAERERLNKVLEHAKGPR